VALNLARSDIPELSLSQISLPSKKMEGKTTESSTASLKYQRKKSFNQSS
jgi:hypothetical protein